MPQVGGFVSSFLGLTISIKWVALLFLIVIGLLLVVVNAYASHMIWDTLDWLWNLASPSTIGATL